MDTYLRVICFVLFGLSAVECGWKEDKKESNDLIDEIKLLRIELLEIRKEFTYKISDALDEKLLPIQISMNQSKLEMQATKSSIDILQEEIKSSMMKLQQNLNLCCPANVLSKDTLKNITNIIKSESEMKMDLPLNLETGSACTWNGVKGTCVDSRRCLSTLDRSGGTKHPVCNKNGAEIVICCTDCEFVNDTRNAVISPERGEGILWKDGRKARDYCLQSLAELPYKCHNGSTLERHLGEEKQCHIYKTLAEGGVSDVDLELLTEFPYQVILGAGKTQSSVSWGRAPGTIISDRYILTSAAVAKYKLWNYVAVGVAHDDWQFYEIKRLIEHPEYKQDIFNNDIALLELKERIQFNERVLPACLPSDELNDTEALQTTWIDGNTTSDTIQTIKMYKHKKEEFSSLNYTTQMCFGPQQNSETFTSGYSGDPLLVKNHISACVYSIVGLFTLEFRSINLFGYTRVSHYVPWIESIVWP